MNGAGNDFVLLDAREKTFDEKMKAVAGVKSRAEFVQKVCDRHYGIGADGVVFIESDSQYDFAWDFYNDDGSSAEMCGNAARCAARFAGRILNEKKPLSFRTLAGRVDAVFLQSGNVCVSLKMPALIDSGAPHLINAGVPHIVIETATLKSSDVLLEEAKKHRYTKRVNSAGVNVTFFSHETADALKTTTFERGVERFTLACGTGAIAAAYSEKLKRGGNQFKIEMPGGVLLVAFGNDPERVDLIGPARFVYEGIFTKDEADE
jgi:diaminopimelate epimerase